MLELKNIRSGAETDGRAVEMIRDISLSIGDGNSSSSPVLTAVESPPSQS